MAESIVSKIIMQYDNQPETFPVFNWKSLPEQARVQQRALDVASLAKSQDHRLATYNDADVKEKPQATPAPSAEPAKPTAPVEPSPAVPPKPAA